MYDQFYGFEARPFQLTPDPHFYFESATHRKALSYLGYGLAQGEGFIVITGDIGAGKTTLVGHLMATIDPARLTAVKIVSTQVGGDDMLRLTAQSFGLPTENLPKAQILRQVEAFLHAQARAGRRSLLIVDEAQNLSVSAIEELRMLSNFQLGGHSLLQIFLLGQPEFRDLLKSQDLEQLRQRVIATHHLDPMQPDEVEPYILHRLSVAGWNGDPHFTPDAFAAIYAATGGVPRRINVLASRVLLLGALDQLSEIDGDAVQAVVADMGADSDATIQPMSASPLDRAEEEPNPPAARTIETRQVDEVAALRAELAGLRSRQPEPQVTLTQEIAALRAEVDALRVEQAVIQSVDPEALKDCFALIEERLSSLEFRVGEQDTALRRVLTLLVEWVEREQRMGDSPRSAAAA
ncbi:XrtA/PEP-CTERM system-associated ATPase [Sphingobium mellinum]|uniref:XrtA/PEP-CTERM system-associated ATPase n=1 Tax=Sphingobium mellinum TaxID=1387166 RepID=UPI0030EC4F03